MSGACVLDASAALSALVAGQTTPAAKAFFLEPAHEWWAPKLLHLEVRDAIHRFERRGAVGRGGEGRLTKRRRDKSKDPTGGPAGPSSGAGAYSGRGHGGGGGACGGGGRRESPALGDDAVWTRVPAGAFAVFVCRKCKVMFDTAQDFNRHRC